MTPYILRRVAMMIPVAFFASAILFTLVKLIPGDPVLNQLGEQATAENREALRRELGLDQPLPVQYGRWVWRMAQGDLGRSIGNGTPVREEIASRIPATLQLGLTSFVISLLVAVPLGILSAVFRRSPWGFFAPAFAQAGVALPGFFVGLVLIYLVALNWRLLPPGSYVPPTQDFGEFLRRLILPAITLSLGAAAIQTRFIRSGLLETLHQEYIRTARSKGLREQAIIGGHALKNALIPSVTLLGLQLALQREFMPQSMPACGVGGFGAGVAAAGFAQPGAEVGVAPAAAGQDRAQDPGDLGPGDGGQWRGGTGLAGWRGGGRGVLFPPPPSSRAGGSAGRRWPAGTG